MLKIFGVIDVKASGFKSQFFHASNGSAMRDFYDACKDPKTSLSLHPEDYHLYYLADFDNESGQIVPVSPIQFLAAGNDMANSLTVDNNGRA